MAPTSSQLSSEEVLTILHFNDVYNVESGNIEPVGGAARFCSALKSFSHLSPLVLFSGDIFAPSFMSTITKGEQMVPVLNALGVHCAVYGNHDFDFGVDVLLERVKGTECPWLMSNVIDKETQRPLADGKGSFVIDWQGVRVGLIGLVEKEWLDTLSSIDPEHVIYTDYVECGRLLARILREEQGCRIVIALTHMRTPNDLRLAREVEEIDLILGGHDHVAEFIEVNNRYVIKSGTDFRNFSHISVCLSEKKPAVECKLMEVTLKYDEDENLKNALNKFTSVIGEKMNEVLGVFDVALDGRFSLVRTSESNLGNFICDIMVAATDSDLAILNSGTLRSDRIHPPGPFTLRDLNDILPMLDALVVLEVAGKDLVTVLENGVSAYPKLEGRFLQVSGISFAFDPTKPPFQRVDPRFVRVGDQYLDPEAKYRMVTKAYLQAGKDGFDVLKHAKVLVDEEETICLTVAVENHFTSIRKMQTKQNKVSRHRQSLVTLSRRHSMCQAIEKELHPSEKGHPLTEGSRLRRRSSVEAPNLSVLLETSPPAKVTTERAKPPRLSRQSSVEEVEKETCKLNPQVEGRIVHITAESLPELLAARHKWENNLAILEAEGEN